MILLEGGRMKREWSVKTLALVIVVLFISVSFQPIIAKDNILPEKKSEIIKIDNTKELLFETILDIANNKEIQNIIQKSEIKGSLIRFLQLVGKLQKEIIGAIGKNDAVNEKLKQLSDAQCDCENDNSIRLWHFPIVCAILNYRMQALGNIVNFLEHLRYTFPRLRRFINVIENSIILPLFVNLQNFCTFSRSTINFR